MRDPHDKKTGEIPAIAAKRGRGRPKTGQALTDVERAAAYRSKLRQAGGVRLTLTSDEAAALAGILTGLDSEHARSILAKLVRSTEHSPGAVR